jgi:catechol 2,3-dioxygenase-like lactoylglutathione lyase family enzyme
MLTKIAVLSIPVKDQQVAKAFYTDVLGCTVMADLPFGSDGVTRWIQLQMPGVETTLTLVTWFPQMQPGSLQGVVLATDDLATTHEALKNRGLAISDIADQPYGREATFSDPDGNGWVLQQPASVA